MPIFNNILAGASGQATGYDIDQSLRFEDGDSAYMTRTPSSAGNQKTWTYSGWIKKGNDVTEQLFTTDVGTTSTTYGSIALHSSGYFYVGEYSQNFRQTTQLFRDPGAWYHFVVAFDTTESTGSNRVKVYVNGEQITDFSTSNDPTQNADYAWNNTNRHDIGSEKGAGNFFDGYMAEVHFIDGQALTPASFGETNSATNQWVPIEVTGLTYGTNGFYLPFSATELANSFTDSSNSAFDKSNRTSWITVTSDQDWTDDTSDPSSVILSHLVDGVETYNDAGGGWAATAWAVSGSYVRFDFGSAKTYSNAEWVYQNSSGTEGSWKWQGSNNASDWTDIGSSFTLSSASAGVDGVERRQSFSSELGSNTTAYRYYQILGISGNMNTSGRRMGMNFGGYSDGLAHTITANGNVAHSRAQKKIGNSSIKFDGSGDYLSCADSSDWSFGTGDFTLETWVRFNDSSGSENLFSQYQGGSNRWYLHADLTNNSLGFYDAGSGMDVEQTVVTWAADTWYHVAMVRNSGTVTYYVNGTAYTVTGTSPGGNITNNTGNLQIGQYDSGTNLNGYLDEIRISNSARYTSGFTPSTTAFTADVNTKLLIHSDFNGGLGADSSGNENDFTPTNLVATDQMLDSPTNNFATLNPVSKGDAITLSEGNLKFADTSYDFCHSTIQGMDKVYFEVCQLTNRMAIGVVEPTQPFDGSTFATNAWIIYSKADTNAIQVWNDNSQAHEYTGLTIDTNGVLSFKIDFTTGNIYAWDTSGTAVNSGNSLKTFGTAVDWQLTTNNYGDAQSGIFNFGQDSSFSGTVTAQNNQDGNGIGDFYRAVPSDYLAMCTDNLPDPAIALPTDHFNTKLYTGTGSELAVTGVGFQPDFTWIKTRTLTYNHRVFDVVRGVTKELYPNTTAAEVTDDAQTLKSFDSDGFTLGTSSGVNPSSTMASWNWKAGGTASSNGDGTETVSLSANPTAGFSIIAYTGTGTTDGSDTVGHGLSQAPELYFVKARTEASHDWNAYAEPIGVANYVALNLTNASAAQSNGVNHDEAPTSSVITLGSWNAVNESSKNFIIYAFHSVEGYSKVGSYTGNGATDGPFIYTGFRPAFIMVKLTTAADGYWVMFDNKRDPDNPTDRVIYANLTAISTDVSSYSPYDILSNGFKSRIPGGNGNEASYNSSGQTYIYLAFAESPFKYSNAR